MCASTASSLLIVFVMCSMRMVAEGLPVLRQEHGVHQDIIAGADFLSVLMDSPAVREAYKELTAASTSTTTTRTTLQIPSNDLGAPVVRELRSSRSTLPDVFTQTPAHVRALPSDRTILTLNKPNASLIISVHVSSSEGDSHINRIVHEKNEDADQVVISSEEHPLVAESSKSEFSVDEKEPITSNSGIFEGYTHEYPANVQPLPKDSFQHHSVIYHDDPREPIRGRSVSYSAVIQTLSKPVPNHHKERQERHYELRDAANENQFEKPEKKNKEIYETPPPPLYEPAPSPYETSPLPASASSWEKPETFPASTEKNWEVAERTSPKVPRVYGKPELNYEVDESVSVMSNGRVHGVQPPRPPASTPAVEVRTGQSSDNQKVGYVVEGRNYRKYRVEERTSDGFIVGEYGVVNHDDGALRGVRYTADGSVNPRLIYNALMKFLSL